MTNTENPIADSETTGIYQENIAYFLDIKISNRLTMILSGIDREGETKKQINPIEESYIQQLAEFFGEHESQEDLIQEIRQITKSILLQKCAHLLTKEEINSYKKDMNWENNDLISFIESKVANQKKFEVLEKNSDFKAYTTTILLAQKMCNEFSITSTENEKAVLLRSYINASKPKHIPVEKRIQLDESFFEELAKQKKAKNPLTFIDITHNETNRENPVHLKMWLYILFSRKDKKNNTFFFTLRDNDIQTFTLKNEGYKLFERIFNAGCQLHRKLINDPLEQQHIYRIETIEDIQQIFLGRYQQPGKPTLSTTEKQNLDGFIDVTECIFHIGSHRLRGKSGKKNDDQFAQLVEKPRNFSNQESWKELFDLQPFWLQVVDKFKDVINHFGLIIDDKTGTSLSNENFMNYVDLGTMKRTIPVKDKQGNKFLFSGRCKELDSIVNKMLNTPKYSHIDAFNDILGTRFEIIQTSKKQTGPEALAGLLQKFMETGVSNPNFKYYSLKGDYTKNNHLFGKKERASKLKKVTAEDGIVNEKTGSGYNEIKLVFKEFEIQFVEQGNNTTGNKDDTIYGFKKIQDILRRIMQNISMNQLNISSMNRWIRAGVTKKRYEVILEKISQVKRNKELIDSDLVHDLCAIQLVHEMLLEEISKENKAVKATSILYILAKEVLPVTKNIGQEFFHEFEKKYTTLEGFTLTYEQLQNDDSPIGKALFYFISNAADPVELYSLFEILKKKSNEKIKHTRDVLDKGNLSPIEKQEFDKFTQQRIQKEKQLIKQSINGLYTSIGGASYSSKVNELIELLDAGKDGANLAKWIFWDALFDKKQKETTQNNNLWARGKKMFQYLSLGVVSKLQHVLNASGTFSNMYPELNTHLQRYKQLHNIMTQDTLNFYQSGKDDFKNNINTSGLAATFYQEMSKGIKESSLYNQYIQLTHLYLQVYIESEISNQSERSFMEGDNHIMVAKVKPSKVARFNKMYRKRTTLEASQTQT